MLDRIIALALDEDIGYGDLTTESIVSKDYQAKGIIKAQEEMIVCGLEVAAKVFLSLDPAVSFEPVAKDGQRVQSDQVLADLFGSGRALLTGERTALNFMQRLSGIATQTARYVNRLQETGARLVDTRKTTPGHRMLEKYAVRCGGGFNHRFGLSDGILIKDNHLQLAGGISQAVTLVRQSISHLLKIEVEIDSLSQLSECLSCGVDCILLDNMNEEELREAVKVINHRCLTEASGCIRLETIRRVAETGVDLISVGALTHTILSVDINMEMA